MRKILITVMPLFRFALYLLLGCFPRRRVNLRLRSRIFFFDRIVLAAVRYARIEQDVMVETTFHYEEVSFSISLNITEFTQLGYYLGIVDPGIVKCIVEFKDSDGGFLDVGANVGLYSILAAHYYREVYSIEPCFESFCRFKSNLSSTGINNVTVFHCALSDDDTTRMLFINPFNKGGNSLHAGVERKFPSYFPMRLDVVQEPVTVVRGDSLVRNFGCPIAFCKIDVEGHEWKVILGLSVTLSEMVFPILVEVGAGDDRLSRLQGYLLQKGLRKAADGPTLSLLGRNDYLFIPVIPS